VCNMCLRARACKHATCPEFTSPHLLAHAVMLRHGSV